METAGSAPRNYVTYFDKNYAIKGITLIQSLQKHDVRAHIHVVCLDAETFQLLLKMDLPNVTPITLASIEKSDPAIKEARHDRSLVEFYWTLTPCIIKQILVSLPPETVLTYVDSDLYFWSSPQSIFDEMGSAQVYIHGHNFPNHLSHLEEYGKYNVGLLCFKHAAESLHVLTWWREKCLEWCKGEIDVDKNGQTRFGDQKYLDYFSSLTSSLCICAQQGVGVAPWNESKFTISHTKDSTPTVDGTPVIMYHHHGFQSFAPNCVSPFKNSYPVAANSLKYFHIPYMCALEKSLQAIQQVQPHFNHGFYPRDMGQRTRLIARKELSEDFEKANIYPNACITTDDGEFYYYNLTEPVPQKTAPAKKLEQALNTYQRFPQKPRLLNLGCGKHFHRSWLNVDMVSSSPHVHACDLREEWPLPQNFFDIVYHSHILEHMSEQEGKLFIKRCYNALKPQGTLRIAVPDLENMARHYLQALEEAKNGTPGAEHKHRWMLIELIDQVSRHHSGGAMAEYCKQSPVPEKDFILKRIGKEGQQLIANFEGKAPRTQEENTPATVGAFRLGGEVHRWMYDAFSLRKLLEAIGFENIRLVSAQDSALPNFADYHLDTLEDGSIRKPDSLFMEAYKPQKHLQSKAGTVTPKIQYNPYRKAEWGAMYYPTWEAAVEAASGYDNKSIFERVYLAAKAVRDGEALWERDSVTFHKEEYNKSLLHVLNNIVLQENNLHLIDFGGALGSTFAQHKKPLLSFEKEILWNVVEQEHIVKCGKREFSNQHLNFYFTCAEVLENTNVNVALFSGVAQYLNIELLHNTLDTLAAKSVPHIVFDRTPLRNNETLFSIEQPHLIYPGASYALRLETFDNFNAMLERRGYYLHSSSQALDGNYIDSSFLCLHYMLKDEQA